MTKRVALFWPGDGRDVPNELARPSAEQATARGVDPAWLEALEAQRRVLRTRVGGYPVWAVVEDAARLRDGLGAPIPPGVAGAHLLPVADPAAPMTWVNLNALSLAMTAAQVMPFQVPSDRPSAAPRMPPSCSRLRTPSSKTPSAVGSASRSKPGRAVRPLRHEPGWIPGKLPRQGTG